MQTSRAILLLAAGVTVLVPVACTSTRTLLGSDAWALRAELEPGDRVVATMHDDRRYEGVVEILDETGLGVVRKEGGHAGERVFLPYAEIEKVEVTRLDVGKSALLGIGVGATAVVVLAGAFFISLLLLLNEFD